MGFVDPIRLLPPHLQRYAERVRAAGPFIPPKPKVPSDFPAMGDVSGGIGSTRGLVIADIVAIVCREADVSKAALRSERRFPSVIRARHVAIWLADRDTGLSSPRLARMFGDCDHSTILRAVRRLNRVIAHHGLTVPDDATDAARLLLSVDWPFAMRSP